MNIARISALVGLFALGATSIAGATGKPPTTSAITAKISAKSQPAGMGGAMLSKTHNLLASKGFSSKKSHGLMAMNGPKNIKNK